MATDAIQNKTSFTMRHHTLLHFIFCALFLPLADQISIIIGEKTIPTPSHCPGRKL
jgi:hypothetical protein